MSAFTCPDRSLAFASSWAWAWVTACLNSLLRAAALALLVGLGASAAWAQIPPDSGRLLEETKPIKPPPLPSQTPPKIIEVPVRPAITMPDGLAVTVTGFRISGAVSFPESQLAELIKPWVGRRLDINGLNEAAGAITRFYQAQGHLLSYAYLPAQRVADGTIEIAVLEGRLEGSQIVTAQDVRLHDEVIQAHTDPLVGSAPLVEPDVERQLLLLNDIPGVTARAAFTPGSSTGAAQMVVSVAEEEPLAFHVEFNNYGTRSTGEFRVGLGLELQDLFGWGDDTVAHTLVSTHGNLVSGSLASSVPLGGNGWRLGAEVAHLTYELAGNYAQLGATGSADTLGLHFSYPFLRSFDANLSARAGYEYKRLRDDILLVGTTNPRRNDIARLSFDFDRRWGASGASAGSISFDAGDLQLLDDVAKAQDASSLMTDRAYRKISGQLAHRQALYGPVGLYFHFSGQGSGGNLDSSEKLGLSGPGAVRAYAPGETAVDQGGVATGELRLAQDYLGGNLLWAVFIDQGVGLIDRLPLAGVGGNKVRLTGSGLAVQWSAGPIELNASLAWRGTHLPTAEGGDPQPRVYVQLVVTP
jgi:hemolysin activation/secretion protein